MANPTEITINKTTLDKGENIVVTLVNPDPSVYHTYDFHQAHSGGDAGATSTPLPNTGSASDPPARPLPNGTQITYDTSAFVPKVAVYYTFTVKTWTTLTGGVGNWSVSGLVGERKVTAVVYPAGTAPSLSSLGLSEGTPAVVSSGVGGYVQGVSALNWNLNGLAAAGTTIVTGTLEIDGVVYPATSGKTAILANAGTFSVKGSVTNNLGQTVTRTESITVLPYEAPKVTSLIAYRSTSAGVEDDNGTYVRLSFAGAVSPLTVGTQKNRTTYTLRTRPRGSATWTTRSSATSSTTLSPTATVTPSGYPQGTAYEVRVDISDLFGASAAVTYVSKGGVLMDWGEGNMGIGRMRTRGTLDVEGDTYTTGKFDGASGVFSGAVTAASGAFTGAVTHRGGATVEPVGIVSDFAGATAPTGWLLCDGAAVSRTTYAALFAVIGTTYGTGNGSSTFNVPNAKGRVSVARDAAQSEFDALGETGGAKDHTLTIAEMPNHAHDQYVTAATGPGPGIRTSYTGDASSQGYPQGITTGNNGGGGAHNNLQPYLVLNRIIKAL